MKSIELRGTTRSIGLSQGYQQLHIRDDYTHGPTQPQQVMYTLWELTDDEKQKIMLGLPIRIGILGIAHPPIEVRVGDPID